MDTYADDLADLVENLDLRDAIMVGNSTGGGVVSHYTGRYGTERVAKAVLISSIRKWLGGFVERRIQSRSSLITPGWKATKLKRKCSRFMLSLRTKYSLTLRAAQQQAFSIRSRDAKLLSRFFNT